MIFDKHIAALDDRRCKINIQQQSSSTPLPRKLSRLRDSEKDQKERKNRLYTCGANENTEPITSG